MVDPLARWKALGLPDKPDYVVADRIVRETLTGIALRRVI